MKHSLFWLFLLGLQCIDAFRQPILAANVLQSRCALFAVKAASERSAAAFSAGGRAAVFPSLLASAAVTSGGRAAAIAASMARATLEERDIRLALGLKTLSSPMIRLSSGVLRQGRRLLGIQTDNCILETGQADNFAGGLADLMAANAACRMVAQMFPASSLAQVQPHVAKLSYIAYAAFLAEAVKGQWSGRMPSAADRAGSLAVWGAASLAAADVVGSAAKLPVRKVLALGAISSAVGGMLVKDISNNLFGGLNVILNDRFRPGDLVSLKAGGSEFNGIVESIGPMQTVIRSSKDQRLSKIPNALLTQAPVTIMGSSKLDGTPRK